MAKTKNNTSPAGPEDPEKETPEERFKEDFTNLFNERTGLKPEDPRYQTALDTTYALALEQFKQGKTLEEIDIEWEQEKNEDGEMNYSSKPEDPEKETPEEKKPDGPSEEVATERKKAEDKAIDFAKPFQDADGNFWENGKSKHYIKHKTRKQIVKGGIMIYEDDKKECQYLENLLPDEVKRRKEKGQIF